MYRSVLGPHPLVIMASGRAVRAIHRGTGQAVWNHWLPAMGELYSIPPRLFVERAHVVVVSAGGVESAWGGTLTCIVSCLEYTTGQPRWQQAWPVTMLLSEFNASLLVEAVRCSSGRATSCLRSPSKTARRSGPTRWKQLRTRANRCRSPFRAASVSPIAPEPRLTLRPDDPRCVSRKVLVCGHDVQLLHDWVAGDSRTVRARL